MLADPVLDEQFTRQGFVTLPVLGRDEAAALRAAYHDAVPAGGEGMLVEYTQADRGRMQAVERILAPVWARHLDDLFVDHRLVFATFVVKYPGTGSSMFLHDDRTYVDERRHRAATLWIPLVDTSPGLRNGSLQIVPGSQRLAVTMSGSNTPELFRPYERHLRTALVDVPVRAGEGLLYDTRVLHASPPNLSDEPREAIACAVAPRSAELIHVVGTSARGRRVHRVDEAFFVEHSPQEVERAMPAGYPVVEEFEDEVTEVPLATVAGFGRGEAPVADPLVPADLLDLLSGSASTPASSVPVRVGSLTIAPDAVGHPAVGSTASPVTVADLPEGQWFPAGLIPGFDVGWLVGDPQVALAAEPGDRCAVRLHPGARLGLPLGPSAAATLVAGSVPPLGAGVTSPGHATLLAAGDSVRLTGRGPHVVWNHGPGPARFEVALDPPAGRRARLAARFRPRASLSGRLGRVRREMEAALGE